MATKKAPHRRNRDRLSPSGTGGSPSKPARTGNQNDGLDLKPIDLFRLVWEYFVSNEEMGPQAIKDALAKDGITISRERPYQLFRDAARMGWLRFIAPSDYGLAERLREKYSFLKGIRVVQTRRFEDIAYSAAEMIIDLARDHHPGQCIDAIAHIGFAGGYSMRAVVQKLAGMLRQPLINFPAGIQLHALVAGFHVLDPTTDPNAFFTWFIDPGITAAVTFVGLHAPPIARVDRIDELKRSKGISESFTRRDDIDIIVTSASRYAEQCRHSQLYTAFDRKPPAGYVCDFLWQPLGKEGPIEEPETRALTLFDLGELPGFIAKRKSVLLVLGPCAVCHEPKTDVLRTVLNLPTPIVTHLVVDSRSASQVIH